MYNSVQIDLFLGIPVCHLPRQYFNQPSTILSPNLSPDNKDEAAQNDIIVDGPGDVLAFVEVSGRFPHHPREVGTPQQETTFSWGNGQ